MNEKDKAAAAIELAEELNWSLFPIWWIEDGHCACGAPDCRNAGKHPIPKLAPHGFKDATADRATIDRWWRECPQANLAARTGDQFWVLDLDGLDGIRAFTQIADEHPDLPETPTARTGGGGRHLYFRANKKVKNATKIGGCPVDVRGQGGYALEPPSNHISGNAYWWELPPTKYELAEAPPWLIDLVTGKNGKSTGAKFVFEGDLATHKGARQGDRNDVLCRLVGDHLATRGVTNDLLPLAIEWGRRCNPPLEEKQIQRTVLALAQKHAEQIASQTQTIVMVSYDTIEPEEVVWLWRDRIALGKLTLLAGDPGTGKTFLMLDITARVSSGQSFPDGASCEKATVIYCSCEDGAADTIRPRLDGLGADVANVWHFEGIQDSEGRILPFAIDRHVPLLDDYLRDHEGVRLLVIDPISGFLGDIDSHKNAEVRGVLAPLAKLAEKHRVAIVGINHLTKQQSKAIYRSLGSLAFVAAARAAWALVTDPDDDERRLLLPVKNNLAAATGLAFRLRDGKVEWEASPVLIAVDDLEEDAETPREEAEAWLRIALADGPVEAKEILKQAKTDGIAERTLRRAKKTLHVHSIQTGSGWSWALPGNQADQQDTGKVQNDQPAHWRF